MAMINRFGIKQSDGTFQYHDLGAKGENVLLNEKALTEVVSDLTTEIAKKYNAAGGEISGEVIPNGGLAHAGNSNYISFPEGGRLRTFSDTIGQLKIYLPSLWDNTLIKFKVSIANYQNNSSVDYFISGYMNADSRKWETCSATSIGKYSGVLSNLTVHFGNNGANCVIGIGNLDTLWQFATVSISDISFNKVDGEIDYLKWAKGWSVLINANNDITFTESIEKPHVTQEVNALIGNITDNTLEDAKEYTDQKIADLIGGAPETLDTLKEIAQEINENQGAIDTINSAISDKANKTDLDNHTNNTEVHVTIADKNRWNAKQDVFTVDEYLSSVSTNPVQNKSVYNALADKVDRVSGKTLSTNDFSNTYKTKLDGIEEGANKYVHPDSPITPGSYTKVTVDQKGHVTKGSNPTLTIAEGGTGATDAATALQNLGLTATAAELNKLDGVTATTEELNYVDGVTSNIQTQLDSKASLSTATQSANGLFSATDKKKLDGIAEGANKYVHPTYNAKTSGLYKITVDGLGHISAASAVTKEDITNLGIPGTSSSYDVATQSANGLMSSTDKKKLDSVEEGANKYILPTASTTLGGVKTTSTVSSTTGYTACPIINGVVYYKDSDTTYTLGSFGVNASATELNYTKGVTSSIQTQLNGKLSTTGTAAAASKLANTSAIGSATQPVYFNASGVPVACTYTLGKSVPSDAKFTDTTYGAATSSALGLVKIGSNITVSSGTISLTKANITAALGYTPPTSDTNTWRPLGTTADTACAGNDARLSNARPASDVYSWAKASTKPSYTKAEIGLGNVDNTADSAKSVNYANSAGSASSASFLNNNSQLTYGASGLNYFNASIAETSGASNNAVPYSGNWSHIIRMNHANGAGYYADLSIPMVSADHHINYRVISAGSEIVPWRTVIDSSNISSQSVNYATSSGYAGSAGGANFSNQLQAFTGDDFTGGSHYVKAIRGSGWETRLWMCYDGGAKQADAVAVNYANTAGTANSVAWGNVTSKPTSYTPASHNQSASTITAGTFPAAVYAYANTSYTTNMIRNSVFTTSDPGAGASTSHANGSIIYVYE